MNPIVETFHLDWKLMLAQLFNFGVVVAVLWFFALKPLLKKMNERSQTIADGLKQADESVEKLKQAEEGKKAIVQEARQQAQQILEEMAKNAAQERQQLLEQSKQEAVRITEETKKQLQTEKTQMVKQAKQEVAGLVVLATQKVLAETVSQQMDASLIQKSLQEAEQELKKKK